MFFIFSKILLFLLNPFDWILILCLLCLVFKKSVIRKRLLIASLVIFILFSNQWIYRSCMLAWQPKVEHISYNKKYSAGIVLTGMTMADKEQGSFFSGNADRFLQTARLYHTGVIQKIFISGGDGSLLQNKPKEADFLKSEFIAQGIPDSVIVVEHDSRNTHESAVAAKRILDSLQWKPPYILITSAVHIPRSIKTFKKAGVDVVAHPAGFDAVHGDMSFIDHILPSISVMGEWKFFLKEVVGLWTYQLTGKA